MQQCDFAHSQTAKPIQRTTGDLLREASSADFGLLAIAYVAMIIFASLTAIKPTDWFLSRSEASFAGVLLVLFAVVGNALPYRK